VESNSCVRKSAAGNLPNFMPAPAPAPAPAGGAAGRGAGRGAAPAPAPSAAAPRKPAAAKPPWQGPLDVKQERGAENKPPGYVQESLSATLPSFKRPVHVGDRVRDRHSKREGICMYVGVAEFARGKEVCGLRLDVKRTTTDCDGKYRGERHFRCTPGHGLYIPLEDAEFIALASDDDFQRAHTPAPAAAPGTAPAAAKRGTSDDTPLPAPSNFDLDKELDGIAGLEEVKEMLRGLRNAVEVRRRRSSFGVNDERTMHMLFLGNPGTGKTKVARLVARMLHSLGILKKGQLIEVTRKDLIGPHHGETAQLTAEACKKALGGVLFIDEAYALRNEGSSDSAGQECVNTLVKESEEHANDLVLILAGYQKEMTTFLATNSGLSSRFPNVFNFADYSYADLASILRTTANEKGFTVDESLSEAGLLSLVQRCIRAAEIPKGNGRLVRNIVEAAIARQTNRVFSLGTVSRGTLTTLLEEDFAGDGEQQGLDSVPEVLARLENIVGLDSVKTYAKQLMAQLQMRAQRKEAGLPVPADASLHMIFSGNPGTGKTTVARILAQAFKSLGMLRVGHLLEVDRAQLVAGYAGQTAIKTKQMVESALGGVLFVDEAYTLVSDDRDTFGKEALDTLMKLTEDYRDDLIVILAGYPADMRKLLARNPGLKSRFPSEIVFSDYSADELMRITETFLGEELLKLSPDAKEALTTIYTIMASVHDRENGNGRAVRNLLERAKRSQALRLMELGRKATRDELSILTMDDFEETLSEMRNAPEPRPHGFGQVGHGGGGSGGGGPSDLHIAYAQ
jgi:SpoVK/Ycf46/Vps4 family AAA+-type ATPase